MMMNKDKGCRRFKFPGRLFFFKCSRESQVWTIDFESFGIIWFSALHTDISFYGRVMVEEKQVGF